jgi:hypothetical protein
MGSFFGEGGGGAKAELSLAGSGPDFLIISPPKTGSTWLAANLARHPEIFVPAIKEVKYFSNYHWQDLSWYLGHFQDGQGCVKGEASPSYALLPRRTIQRIHALFPKIKLIFLMREPITRAWSHAKHNYKFGEANFQHCRAKLNHIANETWRENFTHDWPLASGDYLGQLRRWLSVFPTSQCFVGFYEMIKTDPARLLRRILAFLEVEPGTDAPSNPLTEIINAGLDKEIPHGLRPFLRDLLAARTQQLATFLKARLDITPPDEWKELCQSLPETNPEASPEVTESTSGRAPPLASGGAGPGLKNEAFLPAAFRKEFDDRFLCHVLEMDPLNAPRLIQLSLGGYHVVHFRRRCYAVPEQLFPLDLSQIDDNYLRNAAQRGECLVADSMREVRELIRNRLRSHLGISILQPLRFLLGPRRKKAA